MSDRDLLDSLERRLYQTPQRQSLYVIKEIEPASRFVELYTRFHEDTIEYTNEPQFCDNCSERMPLTCILDSRDLRYEGYTKEFTLSIYACRNITCRLPLYQKMARFMNYYVIGYSDTRSIQESIGDWMKPVFNIRSTVSQNYNKSIFGRLSNDIIYPFDEPRYAEDWSAEDHRILSKLQSDLRGIEDFDTRWQMIDKMGDRFPDYFTAKFGGYPHWRNAHSTVFCECSFLLKPFLIFSHEITPFFCPPETNIYLFVCREFPMQHTISVYFEGDSRRKDWLDIAIKNLQSP